MKRDDIDDGPKRHEQPRSAGTARRHPRRRRDVGRRRFLGRRRPPEGGRLRRRRRDAAALRSWRGRPPHRLVLRRPGYRRRAARVRDARHPALRARLRGAVPQGGDRPVRRKLRRRRDADPLRFLQPDRQVRRSAARPRAISAPMRWRPATTSAAAPTARTARCSALSTPTATRAISCSPPRRSRSTICAFRWAACPSPRCAPSPSAWA